MKTVLNRSLVAMALISTAGLSIAVDDDASFQVTANIASQCVVGNTSAMEFPNLTMLNSGTGGLSTDKNNATASFDAACTNGTAAPTLKFASAFGDGSGFNLKHSSANDLINYTLYEGPNDGGTEVAHNTVAPFTGFEADGEKRRFSVTGRIDAIAKDGKPVGLYSDTVTITVGFTPDA